MVGLPNHRYITLHGEDLGICEFKMAYARPWEFDWRDSAKSKYAQKVIIPIEVIN